jgi:hypothetical protein
MAAPIVYRWDDANAPVARGERRSLCDILYACLVTGYGTKPAAGWTREYVNATFDKAAFRNNPATGTGFYLQVDGAGAANAYQSNCRGFEVMTDENTGLFPFRIADSVRISETVGTTARPWILIADERAFWFLCWGQSTVTPTGTSVFSQLFFGDLVSRYGVDPYCCGIAAVHAATTYHPIIHYFSQYDSATGPSLAIPRPISGAASPIMPAVIAGGGPGGQNLHPGELGAAYTPGDQILISRPHITNGTSYSFRGWLPGYYYPCHPRSFANLATVVADSKTFISINGPLYYYGNFFLSLDDWRV